MAENEAVTPVELKVEQTYRRVVIPFVGRALPVGITALSSDRITQRYRIEKVQVIFGDGCHHNVLAYVYTATNPNVSAGQLPADQNLISRFAPTPYLVGDAQEVPIECSYVPRFDELYIKVGFDNQTAVTQDVTVLVTVQSITDEEAEELVEGAKVRMGVQSEADAFKELDHKGEALFKQAVSVLQGSPEWSDTNDIMNGLISGEPRTSVTKSAEQLGQMFNYIKTDDSDEEKAKKFAKWWKDANKYIDLNVTSTALMDIASLGQVGFVRDAYEADSTKWQIPSNMGKVSAMAFEKSMLKPLERITNKVWLPNRPPYSELINMVVKEKMTVGEFVDWMKFEGYNDFWSLKIWDAHFRQPDFTEIKTAINRRLIQGEDIDRYLARVDLDPEFNDLVWKPLLEEWPAYSELVNMRVKEVIPQNEFEVAMEGHGFKKHWSQKIWDAHFTPPTFTDFLTAMRRKETVTIPKADGTTYDHQFGQSYTKDIDVIAELSILADYDPRYWSFFKTRINEDPSPRQARWGYESGSIDEAYLKEIVDRTGLKEADSKWFSDMLITFQERPYITKYLTALEAAYTKGVITADELEKRIVAIPRRKALADWIIKIADVRKEIAESKAAPIESKLLSVTDIKKAYIYGMLTEDEFRTRLQLLGYETLDIQILIDIIDKDKERVESGGKKTALSVSEMLNAFRYGKITEDDLRTNLMLRGLQLDEAQLLIDTNKAKWGKE